MTRTKVKGFTLMELIVVLATFMIIMFGAYRLMQPSRALFERSYNAEDASGGQKILKVYLEDTLRYAQNVDVSDKPRGDADQDADLLQFVYNHYNGYIVPNGSSFKQGEGVIHVMWIDNRSGGVISTEDFKFNAPDVNPQGIDKAATPASVEAIADSYKPYAVNASIYDKFHYVLSLGATTAEVIDPADMDGDKKEMLEGASRIVTDADYYAKFNVVGGTTIDECCRDSFTITINAYDASPKYAADLLNSTDNERYYSRVIPMTANMALVNTQKRENYLHFDWVNEAGAYKHPLFETEDPVANPPSEHKWCNTINDTLGSGCGLRGSNTESGIKIDPNPWSESVTAGTYANPDCIRIIYSYPLA